MHVRIAWEIYYHQNKQNPEKLAGAPAGLSASGASSSAAAQSASSAVLSSGPSPTVSALSMKPSPSALSLSSASPHMLHRPGELPPPGAAYASALAGRSPFETSPLSASFIGAPPSHIGMMKLII